MAEIRLLLRITASSNNGELQQASGGQKSCHQKYSVLKAGLLHLLRPPPHPRLQRGLGRQALLTPSLPLCLCEPGFKVAPPTQQLALRGSKRRKES